MNKINKKKNKEKKINNNQITQLSKHKIYKTAI